MVKDIGIFTTTVAGGSGVLAGYFLLFLENYLAPLAKKFGKIEWEIWKASAIYTVVSFLGLIVWFSFYQKLEDWKRDLFYSSLIVFLFGAITWSISIFYMMKNKKNSNIQIPSLALTALGSIGLLISTVYSTDNWFLITAASIVLFHHFVFDLVIWSRK